jgi:hypothetical protein
VPSATIALENGVTKLCAGFVMGSATTLVAVQQRAFEAGYARGASVEMIPLPDMQAQPAYTIFPFRSRIANAPPQGSGIALFVGNYHNAICQLQVYGYVEETAAYAASLSSAGWRQVGEETKTDNVASSRFYGVLEGKPATMVVNRWIGPEAPGRLGFVINMMAGENSSRGALS